MLQELNQASLEVGLSMNFKKTKIMCNKHAEDTNRKITIDSNEIEEVDHYIYLGQRISMETASKEQEIKRRITLGWQAFGRASAIFKNKEIPTCLKRQVYNQCIIPTVTYGSETWNLTKIQTMKLRSMQRAHERIMLNITWRDHKTAEWIREQTKLRDILETISKAKWTWAGHLTRRTDNRWTTKLTFWQPRGHSFLLKVVNDLVLSLNKGNISVLALLDFSSAFDTIDHTILVHRLHTDFGFTDTVLQWFSSYLTDRTHYVSLCNHCSDFAPVHSGVPQGSVLSPILFTMYIKPLSAIIDSHSIIHHSFANDLQLQMSAPPDRISELLHSMQSCISDVKAWATVNMLRLNDSKTELMLVTSKRSKHLHNLPTSITIGNAQIPFKQSVKNLGFTLDCHLTMNAHVSNIAQTCYFELRRLAYIRRFLTSTATATLVSAFVLSRIDYCNSLLFGSTLDVTSHLQRIQNYAARVILRLPMSSRITIHLKSLHWLPVKVRSTYKIACLCYHCHSCTAPSYVTDMLHKKPLHTRNTRSSSYTIPLLNRPAHSKATLGDRSFSFASSSVWNSIPNDVKCAPSLSSFKSRLKTYLFRSVYKD